jgi:F-type H+-transporting ATPase subunit a
MDSHIRGLGRATLFYLLLLLFFLPLSAFSQHQGPHSPQAHNSHGKEEKFNFSELIFHHVTDSYEWHLFSIDQTHVSIPLPVILFTPGEGFSIFSSVAFHHGNHEGFKLEHGKKETIVREDGRPFYDFSITKNVMSMFVSIALLCFIFINIANRYKTNGNAAPKGMQSLFEPLIIFIRDDVAKANIGEKHYQRFLPYLLTLFFFIWFNNLLGLLPGGANLTGNIAMTFTLAFLTLLMTLFNAKSTYWKHIFTPPVPVLLYPIMIPVEVVGIFTKPMALMIRLFANITGGHIVILSFLGLIFLFRNLLVAGASVPLVVAMTFLELLVAFLQAYIFTLLTSMYIGGAVEEHHGHEDHQVGETAHH